MKRLLLASLLVTSLLVTSLMGCANRSATDFTSGAFLKTPRPLGRTVVLTRFLFPQAQPGGTEKEVRIQGIIDETFASIPESETASSQEFQKALGQKDWRDVGDEAMAGAARACGADTVAVVSLEGYQGDLTVSVLPPYWSTRIFFRYRVRLLDADTGGLLLEADRGGSHSGLFNALGPRDLDEAFRSNLAGLLAAPQPAGAKS